jgi:uncharacterized protein GlcG (DUF336 family)
MIRTRIVVAATLAALAASSAHAADGGLPSHKYLPIALANEAAMTALNSCTKSGYVVTVVIVDRLGNQRMYIDGDKLKAHNENAYRKAYTSALRAQSSGEYAKFVAGRATTANPAIQPDPKFIAAAGALPIIVDGDTIGAIGVGGAPGGDKDEACAAEGLAKIKDRLK